MCRAFSLWNTEKKFPQPKIWPTSSSPIRERVKADQSRFEQWARLPVASWSSATVTFKLRLTLIWKLWDPRISRSGNFVSVFRKEYDSNNREVIWRGFKRWTDCELVLPLHGTLCSGLKDAWMCFLVAWDVRTTWCLGTASMLRKAPTIARTILGQGLWSRRKNKKKLVPLRSPLVHWQDSSSHSRSDWYKFIKVVAFILLPNENASLRDSV